MSLRDEIAKRFQVDRHGWFQCPNHNDRHPSCHVFVATKGKHKGEEVFYCQVCKEDFMGDLRDWLRLVEGKTETIQKEDPEVRQLRLADERVRKERERLWLAFIKQYPDTPDEMFDGLEYVQTQLETVRLGG